MATTMIPKSDIAKANSNVKCPYCNVSVMSSSRMVNVVNRALGSVPFIPSSVRNDVDNKIRNIVSDSYKNGLRQTYAMIRDVIKESGPYAILLPIQWMCDISDYSESYANYRTPGGTDIKLTLPVMAEYMIKDKWGVANFLEVLERTLSELAADRRLA